jgi:hypothetical protein
MTAAPAAPKPLQSPTSVSMMPNADPPTIRWFYPIDWRELSAVIRFERAQSQCERCRRPHGQVVYHLGDGRWWDAAESTWRNGRGQRLKSVPDPKGELRCTRVMLATAHLDHDPTNNHPRNLRALCQRCHMIHDHRRAMTYRLAGRLELRGRIGPSELRTVALAGQISPGGVLPGEA